MKKLALALLCLVSVAFFASCDPTVEHPEPSLAFMTGDGYYYDGQVIEQGVDYHLGLRAASNPETLKPLQKLVISYTSGEYTDLICDSTISGTEFVYDEVFNFVLSKDIVGHIDIVATVTDEANESKSVTIKLDVNEEKPLEAKAFEWRRDNGANGKGLEEFGLKWNTNVNSKSVAVIEPIDNNATLIVFDPKVWAEVTTESQKAALFSEHNIGIAQYKEISTTATQNYDKVIGTIYNGKTHLIHITKCEVYERGWHFVITGQAK